MQLRTKLLLAFTAVIFLAGVISYTGYTALQTMANYQMQSCSCNTAQSDLLEGRVSGSNFLLYKKPELLVPLSKHFKQAVSKLQTVRSIAHSKENKDACMALIKLIQTVEKNYLNLGTKYKQVTDSQQSLVEGGQKARNYVLALSKRLNEIEQEHMSVMLQAEFYEIRILIYRFFLDPSEETLKKIETPLASFIADTKRHTSEFTDSKTQELFKQLAVNMKAYQKAGKEYADKLFAFQADIPRTARVVQDAGKKIDILLTRIIRNQDQKQERFKAILLVVTAIVLCLGLGISFFLTRNVLSQLGRDPGVLVAATKKIMAGDFNINDNGPKIGVYGAFVDMVKNLEDNIEEARRQTEMARQESIKAQEATEQAQQAQQQAERAKRDGMLQAAGQLEGIVSVVSSASEQLSAQIEQSSRGAEEQSTRVAETATAMEEMNGAVLEVARNAGQASELSVQAREKAQMGAKAMDEAGASLVELQDQSQTLKEDMAELDQHAGSISQIMGVISDIADQTNLLALNAAIEAARAGEAGRGFAVVADEVRKLAEKTMDSTADVSKAIVQIQESATKNTQQVEKTGEIIEQLAEKAHGVSAALAEIVQLVDESSDQVRAIATASEEQSATSEEINRSVTEVNTISTETSQAMREAAQAVTELSRQAQELSVLIQDMKNS